MMERKPCRPRKIVDYSKFADNDSDSDDFAPPVSKKNKVKHLSVDLSTVKSLNLAKPTSTAKCTNKKADVKVADEPKIKDIIAKIKNDDDDFITIGSDEDSQKNCSRDKILTEDEIKTIVVKVPDLSANKDIAKSKIQENEEQLIKCEVNYVTSEPNEKNDEKVKIDRNQLQVSENDKHSQEIKKCKRNEKLTGERRQTDICVSKPTSSLIENKKKLETSKNVEESHHLNVIENVDQQKNIRKWKPPTRTVVSPETKLKCPLSTSNSGLRLGLSRNIRTKPLHSHVKIQS